MKNFKLLPLAVAALSLGFASCSNDRNAELQQGEVALTLTTSIQDQARVTTQTDGTTNYWDAKDVIGVFSTTLKATNVQYTADAAGASANFGGGTVTIPFGTETHDVQAYYPYSASATTPSVVFNLATKNDQPVLWAKGTVTNAAPTFAATFSHKLGKLRIVVQDGTVTPATAVTNATVSVVDVLSKGTLNVSDGTFAPAADKATLSLKAQNNEYYTYLMPDQGLTDLVVKVAYNGKVYNAKLTSTKSVEAGKYYKYTVTLKDGSAEVVVGGNTIGNESEGESGNIDAKPEQGTTPPTTTPVDATVTGPNFTSGVLSATADGGSFALNLDGIESTTAVTAKVVETWVSAVTGENVTLTRATTRAITFVVDKNTTTAERTATVTLTAEGMKTYTFTIKQAAATNPGTGETAEKGTIDNPYTIAEAIAKQDKSVAYVKGYIIGAAGQGPTLIDASASNIMLADSMEETDAQNMLPVQLPSGASRDALNLTSHPDNKGKLVVLKGSLEAYFSAPGLKNVKEHKFL